jgi:uncharacterized protein (TIGR02611 family)
VQQLVMVLKWIGRSTRRIVVSLVGAALLAIGLVMLVTPGPGFVAIIAGLLVLGTEYAWARRALEKARDRAKRTAAQVRRRRSDRTKGKGGAR